MAENWTSSELLLALSLDVAGSGGIGARLQSALREAARAGTLAGGGALPSSRALALELGVARGTVVQAYEQLVAEGYLDAEPGSRTRVSPRAASPGATTSTSRPGTPCDSGRARYDLRPGVPDLSRFPARDWAWAFAEATRRVRPSDLDYDDGLGHPFARDAIAAHLRRVRGADAPAGRLLLATGFAQCIDVAIGVIARRGIRVLAVEDPGDRSVDRLADAAGISLVPIPVDTDGIDVAQLEASDARAVLVTPAHQSPTGAVLSPARRLALTAWAERVDGYIIEDDYDSEFRYDRQPIGAVQGLAPHRVLLIGSASKTHAPGLRLAWMATPASLTDPLADAKRLRDRGSSRLDQYAFGLLLESGRHDRHVRAMRGIYAGRRRVLLDALDRYAPRRSLTGLAAGFHGVLDLPTGMSESHALAAAAERSIAAVGLAGSVLRRTDLAPALVVGFGNIDDESLVEAVAALAPIIG